MVPEGRTSAQGEPTASRAATSGISKGLTSVLAAMAEVGLRLLTVRLLDAECISHDPAAGAAALEAITNAQSSAPPAARIPGMPIPRPTSEGPPQRLLRPRAPLVGFTSRDLRHCSAPARENSQRTWPAGRSATAPAQAPRPPDHPNASRTSRSLPGHRGRTRPSPCSPPGVTQRLLIPGLTSSTSPDRLGRSSSSTEEDRAYLRGADDRLRPASIPRRLTCPAAISRRNAQPCHRPSHTPQLDPNFKIPAGRCTSARSPACGLGRARQGCSVQSAPGSGVAPKVMLPMARPGDG